jgi:cytochrome c-type biogenesis protein CcmE
MAETTAPRDLTPAVLPARPAGGRLKFVIGGVVLLAAVAVLLVATIIGGQETFTTVEDLTTRPAELTGRSLRITGAVDGPTILYDSATLHMEFDIVHIPNGITSETSLAEALHVAIENPNSARIHVVMDGEPRPDLLKHEAQAIIGGTLEQAADGSYFVRADELLLKCPTRYDESLPEEASR